MKKTICWLMLSLIAVSGLVFGFSQLTFDSCVHRSIKDETQPSPKPLSVAARKPAADARKKWEASPDGIAYKSWEVSPQGQKAQASYEKIKKDLNTFADMEAVVTSVTFERANANSTGPKWLIVNINGEEYMMQFSPKDFRQLNGLKEHDKIIVRSRSASCSPNHPFLILSGDYIAQNNTVLFKRNLSNNNGC
ncbi:MAG TPA: hypothetical protein PLS51_05970 [Flavobacterium sp.]|jgi:hypothetical protein|nr:hypothetical protein [Flavobacterium sp.]